MEGLRVKDALLYFFRSDKWLVKLLALIGLLFVPVIGWLAILGYFVRISKQWINEEYQNLPDFSGFGSLIAIGFIMMLALIIYSLPQVVFPFIPCFGSMLSTAYSIILAVVSPYLIAVVATDGTLSGELFNFKRIIKFVQDNIVNLLIFLAVGLGISIVLLIIIVPLVVGGIILLSIAGGSNGSYLYSIIAFALAAIIIVIGGFWSSAVSYSLAGNIYGMWMRRESSASAQPPDANVPHITH